MDTVHFGQVFAFTAVDIFSHEADQRRLQEMTVAVNFADLKLTGRQHVRDLWRQKDLGAFQGNYSTAVASHGTVLVKIGTPRR